MYEIWLKGRETPIGTAKFLAVAENIAKELHASNGREAYVTDHNGVVVYRIRRAVV